MQNFPMKADSTGNPPDTPVKQEDLPQSPEKKKRPFLVFFIALFVFFASLLVCSLNFSILKRPVFQKETHLVDAALAKYEQDGNLYIIDTSSFRLICMTIEGKINYTITIDKMQEYIKMYDCVIDDGGNLYVYAMETEYDAYLTKRDIIRKYNRQGKWVKDILSVNYDDNSEDRPHAFAQFGSMEYENGILSFSRVQKDRVILYQYDVFSEDLSSVAFFHGGPDYAIAQLALRDFGNFIYTTRGGEIYEVRNGGAPLLRASFNFIKDVGGIIPWYIDYDSQGNILFSDMVSETISRIDPFGTVTKALPEDFFTDSGSHPMLTGFGFQGNRFAGVYSNVAWFYDGSGFQTYEGGLTLPPFQRLRIICVQLCFVVGILSFLTWVYLLFIHILDRFISLFIKQIIIILPLTIAAFIMLYTSTHKFMENRLNQEIFNELKLATSLSAQLINGDDLENLNSIKDYNSDAYKHLSETLKEIVGNNQNEWNRGYYAGVSIGNHFEYVAAISSDDINLFRPANYIDAKQYELFMNGITIGGIINTVDGLWAYAEAPIYNSQGKITGMAELGLDLTSHQISNAVQRQQIAVIAVLICLVISLALIGVLSIIVKQLSSVAKVLSNIAQGNYSHRVTYRARDELGIVSRGLNAMAEELENQFEQIHSLNEATVRFVPVQFMLYLGVKDITRMKLGDHVQRNLTVLFFDIRFFSINSELMSAKENFLFINEVLSSAGPVFRAHNGFVDKYLGDAAMVLFVDARDAVIAGIELYRKLVLNKETMVRIGGDGINIGVGIHSGSVMMGIVGEEERLSSTVISKNVNLASRMESLTKQTNSGMLITRETMNQISGSETEFQYRFIGMVQAAGTTEVIGVFDILDALPEGVRKRRLATKKVFESGVRKYHTKDYAAAYKRFELVVNADPSDICAANCLEETKKRLENPDLPSVFAFTKK
jgi:class 3 adenylate cyclase/HAMP domain-containing protein